MSMREATVVSACSGGRYEADYQRCRFVEPEWWELVKLGLPAFCGQPAAYAATSKAHPAPMVFLVCVEHAWRVRLMDWLASMQTYTTTGQEHPDG